MPEQRLIERASRAALSPGERALLARFVEAACAIIAPTLLERILLFGSRTRGQGYMDFDLDLAVFIAASTLGDVERRRLPHRLLEIADQAQTGCGPIPKDSTTIVTLRN